MEDEERQKKLEAGKAKLAEYRQRKLHADSQKKQKKKKKKKRGEGDSEGDSQGRVEAEQLVGEGEEEVPGGGGGGLEGGNRDPPTTEFTFARTLRSGETVKHDQTYTIEPESEVSTTAEDYSSEEEVEPLQQEAKGGRLQDMEDELAAKTQAVEELSRELEEFRAAFGTEGVQQLQDFEAALKQRDGIITQLTANLQQAREEKDEIMREFLEMTEKSQKLHIQFQQLQAGEALRNTSHSSAAADLLQARQQLVHYQQQLEDLSAQVADHQDRGNEQLLHISQLQHKLNELEMAGRRSDESFAQRLNEKDLLIAEQEGIMLGHEQSLTQLRAELSESLSARGAEESFAQTLKEKDLLISQQTAIIGEHERSLSLLREELVQLGRTTQETLVSKLDEKDQIIAEQERVISERDGSLTQLEDEIESFEKCLNDINQRTASKEIELEKCLDELESCKGELQNCKGELESCRVELENGRIQLESCQAELTTSRQKERMSSNEIMQLMGTVEDLQKRCHQGSLSESDTLQRMEAESARKLEILRAELDEMYGQQIVHMKQELNMQHAVEVDQMTEQHRAEFELLKAQQPIQSATVSTDVVNELNAKIGELQEILQQAQAMNKIASHELSQVSQEKLNLQAQVEDLLQDLRFAKDKLEQASQKLVSQESRQGELHHLQDTIDDLRRQLAAAEEAAEEAEAKHESQTTNYKIKLEMLEREKDAVLDRMAQSQEAELDRLRTQLLFSHEEELIHLREDLQRESFLNAENLLNEASIKHERALEELRIGYKQELHLLEREKAGFATERDELLHQILALKEDLKLALHSSKADELVQQLQELQVEVEKLRKGAGEQARMERDVQTLLKKTELLENQIKEKEESWGNKWKVQESEKENLVESNKSLTRELESQSKKIESLTVDNNQMQQHVVALREEIEKQRTTFSFAEKNFEVNYQELKEEYTCLIEVKVQLEERILRETLEFEAKIVSLQSQIRELEESNKTIKKEKTRTDSRALVEKDTTELMEKLDIVSSEKQSLTAKLSEVEDQLTLTEGKLERLEVELKEVRLQNDKVTTQNESLKKELESEQEITREQRRRRDAQSKGKHQRGGQASARSVEDHRLQIESLRGEVEALRSSLRAAETERDRTRHALEVQRQRQTPSPAAAQSSPGEGPVVVVVAEGRSSPQKPSASGSSRCKRRQKPKQERKTSAAQLESREEKGREEEEAALEEERATSAAEPEVQARMESQIAQRTQQRTREVGSTDRYQGDGGTDYIKKQERGGHGTQRRMEPVERLGAEVEVAETAQHVECRLQLEAQRISLCQIHAAQLELLQEQVDASMHSLELERLKEQRGPEEPKAFKHQSVVQVVSEECKQLILSFTKLLGEDLLESLPQPDVEAWQTHPEEGEETRDPATVLLEAKELCRDLQQVKERIEQEHRRLLQLQALLKADGDKMMAMQTAYDVLKSSNEREISNLRMQICSLSTPAHKDLGEQGGPPGELKRLRADVQERQGQLEESHRQELERLRAYYQQQAKETEERYTTELLLLQQRLQEATGTHTQPSLSSVPLWSSERLEEHAEELKLVEEEVSEVGLGAELHWPATSMGLTAQLQTLRKALYCKYVQEVSALKEQQRAELCRLAEERRKGETESEGEREEEEGASARVKQLDPEGINGSGRFIEGPGKAGGQGALEKHQREIVEEEIAKVIVQMSVEFAQQSELARINKRARETTSSMQTQSDEEDGEEREGPMPRTSPSQGFSLVELEGSFTQEREGLERELREKTEELHGLKEQLQRRGSLSEQALKRKGEEERGGEGAEEDQEGLRTTKLPGEKVSSRDAGDLSSSDVITTERNLLRKANENLRQVLIDVMKTTAAAEETIGLHEESLLGASGRGQQHPAAAVPHPSTQRTTWNRAVAEPFRPYGGHAVSPAGESIQGSEVGADDASVWSGETETDEGLQLSQQMTDSLLPGTEMQLENEEYLMNVSSRLQTAVGKLLVAIAETSGQLEHARLTQTELMRESFRHNQEMGELLQRQEELQERLAEEARAREQLAMELHRAEGLIDGYTGERAALEEQARQKEELQQNLEQELQVTGSRLHELEQERAQMQQERELLSRQQDAMREHAGSRELRLVEAAVGAAPEADLLGETEKLMKEKVEVQRQAEKENSDLLKQVKLLEAELEEQVNRIIELEHAHKMESGDLRQQIQALEKQLEKNRKFLDEQAVDREHERDFFQQEILKLEQQLRNPQKLQSGSEQREREVDQLTSQLKEKADWCSELLLGSEQLRREVGERDEEIDKLESRVRELEQALLASTESLEEAEERKLHVSHSQTRDSTLEAQLQTEREALDRKEKEISNLEEQLEQFREELENKSEEVQQLHMQLEIQRKEISSQEQHLSTRDSMLQVMDEKDREIALLNEKITKLQHMDTPSDNKEMDQRDEFIRELETQVECLRSEQERLKRNNEEELDQLNAVIDRLQQELANIEHKQAVEEDEDVVKSESLGPSKEEYDEMKQRMDLTTKELYTLKEEHSKLLDMYRRLKENAVASAETEKLESSEALREKTAGFVVMQAQVQALEQSATSRVEELSHRIQELEALVCEKDHELARCRLLVEQARGDAEDLQQKVSNLEDKLRERVAAALVSQAQLGALQRQGSQKDPRTKDPDHDPRRQTGEPQVYDCGDLEIPQMDLGGMSGARRGPTGKVVLLTEKLRELEVGLSGMQRDQELQKQLLSSSEEEVLEYERRLVVLMDLLSQMKAKAGARQSTLLSVQAPSAVGDETALFQLLQELQEVRDEAAATKEQFNSYEESSRRLKEELNEKGEMIHKLQEQLERVSSKSSDEPKVSELQQNLWEVQNEATATKEELVSYKESCDKLQDLLQEREMTIAHLKGKLFQLTSEGEAASVPELLQELQEVRSEASATKEELSSFRERTEKLQDELQSRDLSIAKLRDELHAVRAALAKAADSASPSPSPSPQPSSSSITQPKKKGGKQQGSRGGTTKDKPPLSRKNSAAAVAASQSSDKQRTPPLHGDSKQKRVALTDSATQTEAVQMPGQGLGGGGGGRAAVAANEEVVEEVIGEFQEKIVQMQELHAAEILDMEARHISESETLRRDTQALEDECKALKAVIDKLRSREAPASRLDRPTGCQFKDGYTSDSSSDYSQRTGYDLTSLHQEFRTTPEGARRETDDALPDRIKTLLREVHQEGMQVLSLSELPLPEGEPGGQGSAKEREALLATVDSLKALITQMQTHRETQTSGDVDWRGELLAAVQQVFVRERTVLKSALYARLDLLDTSDAVIHLNQLERSLAELDAQHREALGSLRSADRSSLLSEVRQLRGQLEHLQSQYPSPGVQAGVQSVTEVDVEGQRERGSGGGVLGGVGGAAEADRLLAEELKAELSQTKLELETTLKAQQKHLKELDTLRLEVSQKAAEVDALTDQLSEEKKRSRELQWAVERQRCKTGRKEESEREELEDLQLALGEQQSRVAQLTSTLEQERQASSQLSQQTEQEHLSLQRRLQELQVQLETERAKAQEMRSALGRERELRRGVSSEGSPSNEEGAEGDRRGLEEEEEGGERRPEAILERLQRELDEKQAQVVRLLGEVEAQKLEGVRRDEGMTLATQRAGRDQEALREARAQLESLEKRTTEAQVQLEREVQRRRSLEQEKERLEERVARLEDLRDGQGAGSGPMQVDGQNQAPWRGEPSDRTKDWVFQQKGRDAQTVQSSTSTLLEVTGTGNTRGPPHSPGHSADKILGKLHLIASKIRAMASKATGRLTTEVDSEELSWMQSNIDEVITMLQQSPGLPTAPESLGLRAGGSSGGSLTERLLRQNAELTGFVSHLTEEKNDLRNQGLRLEEELRRYRHAGLGSVDSVSQSGSRTGVSKMESAAILLSQEREAWNRERVRLEKLLHLAQAEVARLRGEIRTDALRDITGPEADNAALKRMYGKYLRSESFRKALIYQKKYLLLLLGGFQECEEATLSLISRMGGRPSLSSLESLSLRRRGLTRFRSAVRVSIALSRMRFLVKRWHKATVGSSSSTVNRNGLGQSIGTDVRDSPFLHPGSVDLYRERGGGGGGGGEGGSSGRGHTGRDSPRSALSSAHHRFHMAGDSGPLTCSHLQIYDPDRALTDYISRLEALQRRLGSVTSGSTSYAQLHFGIRR